MHRIVRLLLCALLLATPALALGSPGTCSMGSGAGMKAASCCGPACHCKASRENSAGVRSWCMDACTGGHDGTHSAPAAGTLVRATVESLADWMTLAHVHPAAANGLGLDPVADRVPRHSPAESPRLHGHTLEQLCSLLI